MSVSLSPTIKYIVTPAIGFGLAGLIWGWEAYRGTVGAGETFTNPFSYILGAVAFGILGSLSLVIFSGDKKKIFKVIAIGTVVWIASFILPAILMDWLLIVGLLPVSFLIELLIEIGLISENLSNNIARFMALEPSLQVGSLWVEFLLTSGITGFVYSLLLKVRIQRVSVFILFGIAPVSLMGPILGNLVGNLFGSFLVSYFVTFGIIGVTLGLLLGRVVAYQKE